MTTPAGAFKVLPNPAGTRLYILSTSASVSRLMVTDFSGKAVTESSIEVGPLATGAQITPDGRYLLVLAGSLRIYDIREPQPVLAATLGAGLAPIDLAVSHDSRRAFVLSAFDNALLAVDLVNLTATTQTVSVPDTSSWVALGPNGLVYVGAEGSLLEIDGASAAGTMSIVRTMSLGLAFVSGRPAFTPDGTRMVVPNTGGFGPSFVVYRFDTGMVAPSAALGVGLDNVVVGDNARAFAISSEGQLYGLNIGTAALSGALYQAAPEGAITSIAVSNELVPRASNLYAVVAPAVTTPAAPHMLTRVDLNTNKKEESVEVERHVAYIPSGVTGTVTTLAAITPTIRVKAGERTVPIVVQASNMNGKPVAGAAVIWTPVNLTAVQQMDRTNGNGFAQAIYTAPAAAGTYKVSVVVAGRTVDIAVEVLPADGGNGGGPGEDVESGVVIISGQGQTTNTFANTTPKPITVQVRDAQGKPVKDAVVTWELTMLKQGTAVIRGLYGSLCSTTQGTFVTCRTDEEGNATVEFWGTMVQPGQPYAQYAIKATSGGDSETFYVTLLPSGIAGPTLPLAEIVTPPFGTKIEVPVGGVVTGAVKVRVRSQPLPALIPNVGIAVFTGHDAGTGPMVRCNAPAGIALTKEQGTDIIATCDLVGGGKLGEARAIIEIGGSLQLPNHLIVNVVAGPPAQLTIESGNNQSGRPGETLPNFLVATARDAFGNILPGAQVTWEVISGAATVNPATSTADSLGRVSTRLTLGNTPGAVQVRTKAGNAQATFNATVVVSVTGVVKVSGDPQSAVQGQAFAAPLVVKVNGQQGPLAGIGVSFSVEPSGAATLSASSATTNAQGEARVNVTAGNTPGPVTVRASADGQSVTFNLTIRKPGPSLTAANFVNGASFKPGLGFGTLAAIQAEGLAPESLAVGACASGGAVNAPLATRVAGVEIEFSGHLAPIFAVCRVSDSVGQATVQVPFELAPATIGARVRTGLDTGAVTETSVSGIVISNAAPGIFQWVPQTKPIAVAIRPDGSYVTPANPARKGEVIRFFATGLGPVLPTPRTNTPGVAGQVPFFTPLVYLNGAGVSGISGEYAANMIGVFMVTFTVPSGAPSGDVELALNVLPPEGTIIPGTAPATLPIQ